LRRGKGFACPAWGKGGRRQIDAEVAPLMALAALKTLNQSVRAHYWLRHHVWCVCVGVGVVMPMAAGVTRERGVSLREGRGDMPLPRGRGAQKSCTTDLPADQELCGDGSLSTSTRGARVLLAKVRREGWYWDRAVQQQGCFVPGG
jgi:hypothetical protein